MVIDYLAFAGVAEINLYVSVVSRGQGVGSMLMVALIEESESVGLWTLTAGIFPENQASIKLHQKHGFEILGVRKKLAKMTYGPCVGHWRDVVSLERRSQTL